QRNIRPARQTPPGSRTTRRPTRASGHHAFLPHDVVPGGRFPIGRLRRVNPWSSESRDLRGTAAHTPEVCRAFSLALVNFSTASIRHSADGGSAGRRRGHRPTWNGSEPFWGTRSFWEPSLFREPGPVPRTR